MKNKKYTNHNEYGINKNTFELLYKDIDYANLNENDLEMDKKSKMLLIIDAYTKLREKSIFYSLLKQYFGYKYKFDFSKIIWNEENQEYEFEFLGKKYTFDKISNLTEDRKSRNILQSNKRHGKCHEASINLSVHIPFSNVLTGYMKFMGIRTLHSVVEFNTGNILDWTRNILMPKKEYMDLFEFTVLESISDIELVELLPKLKKTECFDVRTIAVFAKEILEDMKRNPSLFETDQKQKERIESMREKLKNGAERE